MCRPNSDSTGSYVLFTPVWDLLSDRHCYFVCSNVRSWVDGGYLSRELVVCGRRAWRKRFRIPLMCLNLNFDSRIRTYYDTRDLLLVTQTISNARSLDWGNFDGPWCFARALCVSINNHNEARRSRRLETLQTLLTGDVSRRLALSYPDTPDSRDATMI